jgi:hypothetical protein
VFEDELVRVSAAVDNPSLEIVFKYPDGSLTNPVAMVTETAQVIRVHGEHCYIVPHLEDAAVAAGLSLDGGRCCSQARPRVCSCAVSWRCPDHGVRCVVGHD